MRSLLFLESLSMIRRYHITIPIIMIPSLILLLHELILLDQRVFIFSAIFSAHLLLLISPLLLSELLKGRWKLIYQANIFNEYLKIALVLMFSSIIIVLPKTAMFVVVYFLLFNYLLPPINIVSLIMIGLFSYSLGSFLKTTINNESLTVTICLFYITILLPFTLAVCFHPDQNFLIAFWPLLALMDNLVNPAEGLYLSDVLIISNFENILIYLLLIFISSWILTKRIEL